MNSDMEIRVLLVCREGPAQKKYISETQKTGATVDIARNYEQFRNALTKRKYNGILLDLPTKLVTMKEQKTEVHYILHRYPVLQLRYTEKQDEFAVFFPGPLKGAGKLPDFISWRCGTQTPRSIRVQENRRPIHYNVLLSKDGRFRRAELEKTITMNVSPNGCFVFSTRHWNLNDPAWLVIKGLPNESPILGTVRWRVLWGKEMTIPGIGLQFKKIEDTQLEALKNAL